MDPVIVRGSGRPATGPATAEENRRLMEVCRQFEAFLVKEVFKELRKSTVFQGRNDDAPVGSDVQVDLADDQFAEWLSRAGGLGLGRMLFESLGGGTGPGSSD